MRFVDWLLERLDPSCDRVCKITILSYNNPIRWGFELKRGRNISYGTAGTLENLFSDIRNELGDRNLAKPSDDDLSDEMAETEHTVSAI